MDLLLIVGKAFGFLAVALLLGQYVSRSLFKVASALHGSELLIVTALAICFGIAWLAGELGLAPIVGAFAAGLILDRVQYRELAVRDGNRELEELLRPLADLFVPVFFVMMGIQVDLRSVADPSALGLAAVLIVAAVIGKQACALGVLGRGVDRLSVGLGMIPRGEVGIIFAAIGRQLRIGGERVIDAGTFSALIDHGDGHDAGHAALAEVVPRPTLGRGRGMIDPAHRASEEEIMLPEVAVGRHCCAESIHSTITARWWAMP